METGNSADHASLKILGRLLRQERIRLGLTQAELAFKAGYSDRLIRKAEGNGRLNRSSVADIITALVESGSSVCESDLTCDPVAIAREFLECLELFGRSMMAQCEHLLFDPFTFECAGDPETSPVAGVFVGRIEFQRWLDSFHLAFARVSGKKLNPEYLVNANHVIARYVESDLECEGKRCPPIWVNLFFEIHDGLIHRVRDEFDTFAGARFLESCQLNTAVKPCGLVHN